MRCVFYALVWTTVMCGTLAAQSVPAVVSSDVKCAVEPTHYDHWYRETSLSQGKPYVAAEGRKQQILSNYQKLTLQMSLHEVETLLGKPDFGTARPPMHLAAAPEPEDRRCTNDLAYVVEKKSVSMIDLDDVAIYLSFSRDGTLYWAAPQNLPNLKPLGSPSGETPNVQSQVLWREYIFADDGFAITLPSDPHPHKSAQVNGMAYSVPLSSGARFSLYTEEANDKCVDTVRSQLANAKSTAESRGFTVISFREIEGTGYAGVESVQKVPTGKIDYERWICAAHRLYLFVADWNPHDSEPKELQRIVDSWHVVADK